MKRQSLLGALLLATAAVSVMAVFSGNSSTGFAKPPNLQFETPTKRDEEIVQLMERESRAISARTINRFHLAIIARIMHKLPRNLRLRLDYSGVVASDHGQPGLRVSGSLGDPLEWTVLDESGGVFSMLILTVRTPETICACQMEQEKLFVSVTFVDGYDSADAKVLDTPMSALGDRTVRQVVRMLEADVQDLEKPYAAGDELK